MDEFSLSQVVELAKENQQMKQALQMIIDRSFNDPLGTSKVIDMRTIAQKALNGEVMNSLKRSNQHDQ